MEDKVMAGETPANPATLVASDPLQGQSHSYIGQRIRRREDLALVKGRGRYAGDLRFPGLLYAAVCRSTSPHGVLRDVHLETVRSMPGVVAAFASSDLPEVRASMVDAAVPEAYLIGRPVLARERVRYV